MSLSLNVFDILKFFRDRGVNDRRKVAEYVQKIADEASEIASIWGDLVKQYQPLINSPSNDKERATAWVVFEDMQQEAVVAAMARHYRNASSIVGALLTDKQRTELFDAIGGLLAARYRLKPKEAQGILLPPVNSPTALRTIVSSLQHEAGVLQALASELKAT